MRTIILVPELYGFSNELIEVKGPRDSSNNNFDIYVQEFAERIFTKHPKEKIIAICAIDFEKQQSTIMEFTPEIIKVKLSRTDY